MSAQRFLMVAGTTLNGKITDGNGSFLPFSSDEDQKWLKKMINDSDVLIVGRKTYEKHAEIGPLSKPHIVFTQQIKGIQIKRDNVHFFNDRKDDLINLCDILQYKTITILGGSEIYHWFLKEKILSDIYLTIEPHFEGKGLNLLSGPSFIEQEKWKLKKTVVLNSSGTLLLHYQKK
ncbi:MAG: dihydrofolate reductase [Candidatus Gracilibacteria bacterium]|nr:dihydrofolate reductase [Candidatus Gracilibacteria bacterium]